MDESTFHDSMIVTEQRNAVTDELRVDALQAITSALIFGDNAGLGAVAEAKAREADPRHKSPVWLGAGNMLYLSPGAIELLVEAQGMTGAVKRHQAYLGDGFHEYFVGAAISNAYKEKVRS